MESKYCQMKDGCFMCDLLMCEGKKMSERPKVYHCQKCGKEIGNMECYESAKILRKRVPDGDPKIFDVWFMDYCNDCAENMDIEKEFGKEA